MRRWYFVLAALVVSAALAPVASAGVIPGHYIVVLKDGASEPAVRRGAEVSQHYRRALNGYAAKLPAPALAAVRADPRVQFVAPDEEIHATACDAGPEQRLPCSVDRIDGETSTAQSGNGSGIVNIDVAVLDTGIDVDHPDLNVVGGKNCVGKSFDDENGHGTHVGGTIGMEDNAIGRVGVAPGASLWAVRVLNKNGIGNAAAIICGIDFVTATRTDADPSNDIAVANMSLSGKGTDDGNCGLTKKDPMHTAICNSVDAGVTYTVGAGNAARDLAKERPAAYDEVLTATAMSDFDGQPGAIAASKAGCGAVQVDPEDDDASASFSNFATLTADRAHTVAAPGICVDSAYLLEVFPYGYISGTSMASPHVAGTVALCISSGACAGLTPPQIVQKIVADATAYNTANPGYGFLGDPLRPITGKYYGYLIRAGLY